MEENDFYLYKERYDDNDEEYHEMSDYEEWKMDDDARRYRELRSEQGR